jgi:hypothetical protein
MVETAAKYGNLKMMKRLIKRAGVTTTELNAANVAAFTTSRADISDYLIAKGATAISLHLCCHIGDVRAVKKRLSEPLSDSDIYEALEYVIGQRNKEIIAEIMQNPKCQKVLRRFFLMQVLFDKALVAAWCANIDWGKYF